MEWMKEICKSVLVLAQIVDFYEILIAMLSDQHTMDRANVDWPVCGNRNRLGTEHFGMLNLGVLLRQLIVILAT